MRLLWQRSNHLCLTTIEYENTARQVLYLYKEPSCRSAESPQTESFKLKGGNQCNLSRRCGTTRTILMTHSNIVYIARKLSTKLPEMWRLQLMHWCPAAPLLQLPGWCLGLQPVVLHLCLHVLPFLPAQANSAYTQRHCTSATTAIPGAQ